MQIKKEFVLREIAGEYVIIPTGTTALEFNGLITVNETGVFLWEMLQNDVSVDEMVAALLEEYDVEETIVRDDVLEFVETLKNGGILSEDK